MLTKTSQIWNGHCEGRLRFSSPPIPPPPKVLPSLTGSLNPKFATSGSVRQRLTVINKYLRLHSKTYHWLYQETKIPIQSSKHRRLYGQLHLRMTLPYLKKHNRSSKLTPSSPSLTAASYTTPGQEHDLFNKETLDHRFTEYLRTSTALFFVPLRHKHISPWKCVSCMHTCHPAKFLSSPFI